ncbi:hypothetical protein [Ferdinandcohnia sp. Marseille-Q9671]
MSTCNLDHSKEDVFKKLKSQDSFLPKEIFEAAGEFLTGDRTQSELNELFHLLKKYDLATEEEQLKREQGMEKLFQA